MAANEILPSGSMDVNGLIEEVLAIRKDSASSEEAKELTFDTILKTSQHEWQTIAKNEEMKEKINMIAVKNMEEAVENSVMIDYEADNDLEKIVNAQISTLKNSIEENLDNEV
jgi:hypothetical protein